MLRANYFDGSSTRVHAVDLSMVSDHLVVRGETVDFKISFDQVQVDERLGRAARRLRFKGGAFCEVSDLAGLDGLLAMTSHQDGRIDRMQRRLPIVLISCVALVALTIAAYRWGVPWAAAEGARRLPMSVGRTLTTQELKILDGRILLPSNISAQRRKALSAQFMALQLPGGGVPDSKLLFRGSSLGANAFTLPDGTIIVLDDLITAINNDQQIMAVLSHELGHVHGRHGLQLLLESSIVGAFWAFYIGDISQLLAAAPVALAQAKYSQDLERQADDYGAALLRGNGMSPQLLADVLKKLVALHPEASKIGYLSSHPSTDERMRHLHLLAAHTSDK